MKAKLNKVDNGYVLLVDNIMYATDNDKLSKQNCDEIFGVVDVEKLAYDSSQEYLIKPIESPIFTFGYEQGFNKAMELNKDKVFSKEDMAYIMNIMSIHDISFEDAIIKFQLLQQPTEIEVEIEMECKI